jgi:hypothetical protein
VGGWWTSVGAQEEAEPSRFKPLLRWANEQPTQAAQAAQAMQMRPLVGRGCRCDWLSARPSGSETTPAAPAASPTPALLHPDSRRSRAAKRRSPRPARRRVCQPAPRTRHALLSPVQPSQLVSAHVNASRLVDTPAPLSHTHHSPTATRRPALLGLGVGMGMGMIPTPVAVVLVSAFRSPRHSLGLAIPSSGPSARALAQFCIRHSPEVPYPTLERRSESTCHAPDAHSNMRSFGSGIRIQ